VRARDRYRIGWNKRAGLYGVFLALFRYLSRLIVIQRYAHFLNAQGFTNNLFFVRNQAKNKLFSMCLANPKIFTTFDLPKVGQF